MPHKISTERWARVIFWWCSLLHLQVRFCSGSFWNNIRSLTWIWQKQKQALLHAFASVWAPAAMGMVGNICRFGAWLAKHQQIQLAASKSLTDCWKFRKQTGYSKWTDSQIPQVQLRANSRSIEPHTRPLWKLRDANLKCKLICNCKCTVYCIL